MECVHCVYTRWLIWCAILLAVCTRFVRTWLWYAFMTSRLDYKHFLYYGQKGVFKHLGDVYGVHFLRGYYLTFLYPVFYWLIWRALSKRWFMTGYFSKGTLWSEKASTIFCSWNPLIHSLNYTHLAYKTLPQMFVSSSKKQCLWHENLLFRFIQYKW